jgi:hypothetical protein
VKAEKINKAVKAAQEFLARVDELAKETSKKYTVGDYTFSPSGPKQSGALRRQSMELTRALAEMRKP